MVQWISSWTGGIVVAVVLATIIEMLLPSGNNKKYVKTVIGIFILFSIIGPVINKFTSVSLGTELEQKMKKESLAVEGIDTNQNIQTLYQKKMEQDIKTKLKEKGYAVTITALSICFIEGEDYGKINSIYLKVENEKIEKNNTVNTIKPVEKVEITIGNDINQTQEENNLSEDTRKMITTFLIEEYKMEKENIHIN